MIVSDNIYYIGVNDKEIDLFEGHYIVPNGMAYNSYLIVDEKCAVMDSVDKNFGEEWLENIAKILGDKSPDYLIVQHMEPDHSANIDKFAEKYPNATIVSSSKAFGMMKNFFDTDYADRRIVVGDGDSLSLGKHTLRFTATPMVHWPEVIMTFEESEGILFSADAFGKFGALDVEEEWACEARRYYIGIVGKYGVQVQAALKKLSGLNIKIICPLHGPVLSENLGYYIGLYDTWSSYRPEEAGVAVCYASVYGNTEKAALYLADKLEKMGVKVAVSDLARCDMAEAVEDAFRYSAIVLASTTYNGDVFPPMREFLASLAERGYKNRAAGIIENGSWAPMAAKVITNKLSEMKDIKIAENTVKILSAPKKETYEALDALATELKELSKIN